MLNKEKPEGAPRIVYSSKAATQDLGVKFKSVQLSLSQFE
jgi:hypothetical protein